MKYCPTCEETLNYNHNFCPDCGTKAEKREVSTYEYCLHSETSTNRMAGEELGLTGYALDTFIGCCYEVRLQLKVYSDGKAYATHLNDVPLLEEVRV